jgi:hypothetical protein
MIEPEIGARHTRADRNACECNQRLARFLAAGARTAERTGVSSSIASSPRNTARRNTTERESLPTTKMSLLLRNAGINESARCKRDLGNRRVTMLESAIGSFLRAMSHARLVTRARSFARVQRAFVLTVMSRRCAYAADPSSADNTTPQGKRALIVCSM